MRVHFVVPFVNWTGGLHVVDEYATRLQKRGHVVKVYFPITPYLFADNLTTIRGLRRWLGDLVLNLRDRSRLERFASASSFRRVPWIGEPFLPRADAVICTAWPTAGSVYGLRPSRGAKFYFIQHYESWSGPPDRVDRSYRFPMHKIVIASWLRELMEERFGQPVLDAITNGVDPLVFFPDPQPTSGSARVLMQYSPLAWKGVEDGLKAWERVKADRSDARLVMFGVQRPEGLSDVEFHEGLSQRQLRAVYNSCAVFVSPSWSEGCQAPPMEAMACARAVVATNVGGIPDYAVAGKTALVVEPHDVDGLACAILRLLEDDAERQRVARAGFEHIQQFTWDKATDRLEQALLRGISLG